MKPKVSSKAKAIDSERMLKRKQTAKARTKKHLKNQEVSFLHQRNGKAVDDKWKESDLRKYMNDGFDARYMEIKLGSRYSGNPGN